MEVVDPISNEKVKTFAGGEFELLFKGASKNGFMPLAITYIGCTDKICLFPYTVNLNLKVYPAIGQPPATADTEMGVSNPLRTASQPPVLGTEATEVEQILVDYAGQSKRSFLWLIIIALIGGILTNFTPCVLPMIPITLKTLGNQHARPVVSALVYGVGIITSYSALGMIVATTGGLFGAILGNTWFTLTFSCIMFVFGLTMLGWGNLAFLQRLGVKLSTTKASLPNAFCLGLGAGLVAAPCTGPILGALLAYSATQLVGLEAFALFFVYSLGFAIPYMFAGNFVVRIARVNIAPRDADRGEASAGGTDVRFVLLLSTHTVLSTSEASPRRVVRVECNFYCQRFTSGRFCCLAHPSGPTSRFTVTLCPDSWIWLILLQSGEQRLPPDQPK